MYTMTKIAFISGLACIIFTNQAVLRTKNQPTVIKEITTMQEYEKVIAAQKPTILVFNSSDCTACTFMEESLKTMAKTYGKDVDIYALNAKNDVFKDLPKKLSIKAFPTTYFIKSGKKQRDERGAMGAQELEGIVHYFLTGKVKPMQPVKKETATPAHSAQALPRGKTK